MNNALKIFYVLGLTIVFFACNKDKTAKTSSSGPIRFELVDPSKTGINFVNILNENSEINYLNFNYLYIGGAIGIGDFNRDGLQDIYMVAILGENKLYLNKGNFQFEDVTATAGVGELLRCNLHAQTKLHSIFLNLHHLN